MTTIADTGQLIVYVTDERIDESWVASVSQAFESQEAPAVIDLAGMRAADVERIINRASGNAVICNLLDPFYDLSISTRESARLLGKVKSRLESLVESGASLIVLCARRSDDLGTRLHFMASLCAAADRVYFRSRT